AVEGEVEVRRRSELRLSRLGGKARHLESLRREIRHDGPPFARLRAEANATVDALRGEKDVVAAAQTSDARRIHSGEDELHHAAGGREIQPPAAVVRLERASAVVETRQCPAGLR